jgi:dihydrofolate reductase
MRKIVGTVFVSLDGVMQAPGGVNEDITGGFAHGGWQFKFPDPAADATLGAKFDGYDLLLGRKTYDIFAAFWPNASGDQADAAGPLNRATKYVASRGTPDLSWDRSVLLEGDAGEAVAALKQTDGPELQVHGSGDLVQTLLAAGLVDLWHLVIHPVLIGSGRRLFADGTVPVSLRLVEGRVTKGGTYLGTYAPDGEVKVGSFA